ncbi:MAG: tetratricopeptide repeat protein [Leptolyngbyaceae cyanobacterium]
MYPQQFSTSSQTICSLSAPVCWYSTLSCDPEDDAEVDTSAAENSLQQGIQACYEKQFDQALTHFKQALQAYTQAENAVGVGKSLNSLSAVYLELQQYARSLAYSQASVAILENTEAIADYALALHQLGVSHLELQNPEQAENYLNHALSLYITLADEVNEDHVVLHLGQLYAQNHEYLFALAAYESVIDSVLERPAEESTQILLLDVLHLIVQLSEATHRLDIALTPYHMVLECYTTVDNPEAIAPLFHQLGQFYETQERYGLAAACYAQAPPNDSVL